MGDSSFWAAYLDAVEVAAGRLEIDDKEVGLLGGLAALLALGVLYQQISARRQRERFAPPGAWIDVGGHRLHVTCNGAGRPVVLLESGIAASSLSWAVVQPAIATFTRVCSYDRAGLAWSDPPSCLRTFDRIVAELSAVLEGSRTRRAIRARWTLLWQLHRVRLCHAAPAKGRGRRSRRSGD